MPALLRRLLTVGALALAAAPLARAQGAAPPPAPAASAPSGSGFAAPIEANGRQRPSLLNYQDNPMDRPSNLPDSFFAPFPGWLAQENYTAILDAITRANAQTDSKTLRWLEAASRAGHVRMMWELAEDLARVGRFEKATYWSYAALIGTYQEADLCTSAEIRFAPGELIHQHPLSREAADQNAQIARDAMRFAFQLNARLPSVSPEWICRGYAKNKNAPRAYFYDPPYWPDLRYKARVRLAKQLLSPPGGWTPGLAEAVGRGEFPPALWQRN
jgi:hypothetical protein